jgi:hypothetical protein
MFTIFEQALAILNASGCEGGDIILRKLPGTIQYRSCIMTFVSMLRYDGSRMY